MNARSLGAVAVAAAACLIAGAALACGDKLVALGGGVGFDRVMTSRNPGHIVLLLEPSSGLTAANEKFKLASSLSLAGHEVFIVTNPAELRAQGDTPAPDLILVDAERARQLQIQSPPGGSGPTILRIAYVPGQDEPTASELPSGCVTVAGGRKGSQVLKAVENAMKLRSRGLPLPCEANSSQQA